MESKLEPRPPIAAVPTPSVMPMAGPRPPLVVADRTQLNRQMQAQQEQHRQQQFSQLLQQHKQFQSQQQSVTPQQQQRRMNTPAPSSAVLSQPRGVSSAATVVRASNNPDLPTAVPTSAAPVAMVTRTVVRPTVPVAIATQGLSPAVAARVSTIPSASTAASAPPALNSSQNYAATVGCVGRRLLVWLCD